MTRRERCSLEKGAASCLGVGAGAALLNLVIVSPAALQGDQTVHVPLLFAACATIAWALPAIGTVVGAMIGVATDEGRRLVALVSSAAGLATVASAYNGLAWLRGLSGGFA
ncbi:MAG: hypothetical protein ACYTGR_07165 [Planctomycetota bacterium]|jgi:hypothetical protein